MKKPVSHKHSEPTDTGSLSSCERAFRPGTPCCTILKSISEGIFAIDLDKRIIIKAMAIPGEEEKR
ncbi:MAG TPA: hypothetical protein P5124_09955 [Syntrophorhabdaceae bacterium]|nr:hypothetical protein [Syntrophorhabdaceae bacterium]HQK47323.1 hypothetical protein [Syntrophorhabdaceae bacterium]HRR72585.1 hypothetical protein [Syntrophorhabdaceae bacterium]